MGLKPRGRSRDQSGQVGDKFARLPKQARDRTVRVQLRVWAAGIRTGRESLLRQPGNLYYWEYVTC
jgi:hypothetical protein